LNTGSDGHGFFQGNLRLHRPFSITLQLWTGLSIVIRKRKNDKSLIFGMLVELLDRLKQSSYMSCIDITENSCLEISLQDV
jgi:hypothetical protein